MSTTQENVDDMRAAMPAMLQAIGLMAQLQFAKFQALIKAGFTEEQALKLCDKIP